MRSDMGDRSFTCAYSAEGGLLLPSFLRIVVQSRAGLGDTLVALGAHTATSQLRHGESWGAELQSAIQFATVHL